MKSPLVNQLYVDNWPRRRKWMVTILVWAIANAQYVIVWGADTGLHQNALMALLGLIAAIIGSYVFGAVWDDNDKRRHMRNHDHMSNDFGSNPDGSEEENRLC